MTSSGLSAAALTPSEVVFLRHGHFVEEEPEYSWSVPKPIVGDLGTYSWNTAQTAWRAAFLAAEQTGDIRLAARPKKVLLGLRTVTALYSEPLAGPGAWSSGCLEARLSRMPGEVLQVVYACIGGDFESPDRAVLDMIRDGLVSRGLLHTVNVVKKKWLLSSTTRQYELGEDVYSWANDCIEGVDHLIRECQTNRPDIWGLLLTEVARGISRRQERRQPDSQY
jgi:hypothetical protein